ncbi:hypothetical protein B7C62_05370 [Kitasatospora albolonga]|uniref:Lipoprotein n=1 Tax=Kitasatospora albolonga TaxID=68173 RepID=A0ABC8BMZ8_9ACTN|nr:hypothetical protein B7C62_05370 [Kitasatospora albolonga]
MKFRPQLAVPLAVSAALLTACSGSGQELGYGEKATGDDIDVTVLRVEAGSTKDLAVLKDASEYAGRTPYYLHYRVTKTKDGSVKGPDFAVTGDGRNLTRLSIMPGFGTPVVGKDGGLSYSKAPKFDKCTADDSSSDFNEKAAGESYTSCSIYLTAEGDSAAPTEVAWLGDDRKEDPVAVWK